MAMTWQEGLQSAVHGLGVGLAAGVKVVRVFLGFLGDLADEVVGANQQSPSSRRGDSMDFDPYDPVQANFSDAEARATLSGKYSEWVGSSARHRDRNLENFD